MLMPSWNVIQWKMPGAISFTRRTLPPARLDGGADRLAVAAVRALGRARARGLLPADRRAQLVQRALEALHQRPRVAHQVAVAHEAEVDVVAVAHHGHVEPDAVRHDRHREVRLQ